MLFRIRHFIYIGELSRKGGDRIVLKFTREDLGLGRLRKFDKERDYPRKVFKLGRLLVVVGQLFVKIAEYRGW